MTDPGPYSRVYWTVLDDKKFDEIRADMRHFGSWTVMLVVADMAYPAPAFIPPHVSKASLTALVKAELIDLLPARMYRVRGQKKERERRAAQGRPGARARWDRNANAEQPDSDGNAVGMPDETSKAEQSKGLAGDEQRARDETLGTTDDETDLFAFIAQRGAFIRPDSGFGIRLLGLIDRRGIEAVMEKARALDAEGTMSDRQWVFGLEKALEAIPSPPMEEMLPVEDTASRLRFERMAARRIEWFAKTGKWDPNFGPEPEWNPEWGERPNVVAA